MAKAKESKIEAPRYKMPPVEMGDIVLWHAAPDEPAVCAAVVTEVCSEGINVSLIHRNMYNMEPKDGVRHKDHPDRKLIETTEAGCWSNKHMVVDPHNLEALFIAGPAIEV